MHDFIISCIGHLENTGSLSYAFILNVDTANFMILKITLVNITIDVTREEFKLSISNGEGYNFFA